MNPKPCGPQAGMSVTEASVGHNLRLTGVLLLFHTVPSACVGKCVGLLCNWVSFKRTEKLLLMVGFGAPLKAAKHGSGSWIKHGSGLVH